MTPSEMLLKAAELVERGWSQGRAACSERGGSVHPNSRDAVRWCALGAMRAVSAGFVLERDLALEHLRLAIGKRSISHWNDTPNRTQAEVVAALREAAETYT